MAAEDATLLFGELRKAIRKENFERVLKLSNELLKRQPADEADPDLLKCKCVSLLHLQQYEDALVVARRSPAALRFEQAYCCYRLSRFDEALRVLREVDGEAHTEGMRHLEAQLLYQTNQAARAADVYQALVDETSDEPHEVLANAVAAYTAAGSPSEGVDNLDLQGDFGDESWELAYNLACAHVAAGQYHRAEALLRRAEQGCRRTLMEEGCAPADIADEVAIVQAQRAFVLLMLNRADEALRVCQLVAKAKPQDGVVNAVNANNLCVLRKDKDVFDSHKRLRGAMTEVVEGKLLPPQLELLRYNRCLLLLFMNKLDECRAAASALAAQYPTAVGPRLIDFTLRFRKKQASSKEAVDELRALAAEAADPQRRAEVELFLAQMQLRGHDLAGATATLTQVEAIRGFPATVATLVALHRAQHDDAAATAVLDQALADVDSAQVDDDKAKAELMARIAASKMERGAYREAAAIYQRLVNSDTPFTLEADDRLAAMASLVVACSWFDHDAAEEHAMSLPPVEHADALDPTALEQTTLPRSSTSRGRRVNALVDRATQRAGRSKQPADPAKRRLKRDKARALYLERLASQGKYDPTHPTPPDPERWIAKASRSYNRRGRKNKNKFSGAQGAGDGTAKDAAKLDAFARAQAKKEAAEKAAAEPAPAGPKGRKPYRKKR